MSNQISQFATPRIDARALLGLGEPASSGNDWGLVRAAQLAAASQLALFMLAANLVGALIASVIVAPFAPLWQIATWGALVAAVSCAVAFRRLSDRRRAQHMATAAEVRAGLVDGLALGAAWAIAAIYTLMNAPGSVALGAWLAVSVVMAAGAMAMAALPLAGISFLVLVGVSMAAALTDVLGPSLGGMVLIFTAVLVAICYGRGRAIAIARITELAIAERDETVSLLLRETEAEHDSDWLWEIDAQRRVIRASPRFAMSLGLDTVSINGKNFLEVLAGPAWETGRFSPALHQLADKLKGREPFRDLLLPVHIAGQQRWWEITASPRFDDRDAFIGFRGVGSDVTEARQSADKINRMARYDTLTGLPNRLLINETLAKAMAEADKWGSRCAFMMIDLDRFKAVNDTLGHPVGDRLLGRVSERLTQMMGPNEMMGRLGGDEFAVVVRDASDTARVEALAHAIIEKLSQPYEVDQHTLYIGASVGLAIGPRDGRTAEMLIRSADLALYRSKDVGGGVFHAYEPQLHMAAEERRVLEIALRSALANGEMHLAYQPVVDAAEGRLTGFEALLRWTHPEFGNVSPVKFVPLAEEARLIAPIGEWVLRTACMEAASWRNPARIAVNVSAEQLHNPAFVTVVAQALAQSGLPPAQLELEVTESVFMREGTGAVRVLEQILDMGVRLSLDDFGTGYSSLGYLSRTRFSTIKIDRSFVQGASKGVKEAIAIIRAVVALADSLGMATTAEGVETEEEHRMIHQLGCKKVQGYYFGRPLPTEEARALANPPLDASEAA